MPFTALNGSIHVSMVDRFTAMKGYPASESKILHLAKSGTVPTDGKETAAEC